MGGTIFISYRRGADSGFAGRLYDWLVPSFGRERVFMDVDSIAPGEDFVAVLKAHVAKCDVLLALIGRGWLNVTDGAGQRRLDNPEDFVRIEIAAALAQGKRVIPVVIDDAAMPRREDLPEEIKPLARRNTTRLTHDRFKDDAERLVRALEKALADAEAAGQAEEAARTKVEEEKRQRAERERQHGVERARQRAEGAARRRATEATRKVEEERQRAATEAKRQAQDQERRRTEAERQSTGGKSSFSGMRWIIGAAIVLAVGMGAIFVWSSPERTQILPVTAEQKTVTPSPPADAEKAPEERALAPRTFRDCEVCPEMVALPAGAFLMGSPESGPQRDDNEGPQHAVTIRPFAIGKYELTFEEWDACVAADGCNGYRPDDRGWGRGRRPVINVSWRDAQAYVDWLAKITGKPYRLPSEAEWEYAARGGTTTRYAFGDEITGKDANFRGNVDKTTEVGAYPANAWGLYDMHGNVWEWVEDVWHDSYSGAPTDGSAWTDAEGKQSSRYRVGRGGSWSYDLWFLRSAYRLRSGPESRNNNLGFRVARTLD